MRGIAVCATMMVLCGGLYAEDSPMDAGTAIARLKKLEIVAPGSLVTANLYGGYIYTADGKVSIIEPAGGGSFPEGHTLFSLSVVVMDKGQQATVTYSFLVINDHYHTQALICLGFLESLLPREVLPEPRLRD